jgi:hypothetical protein
MKMLSTAMTSGIIINDNMDLAAGSEVKRTSYGQKNTTDGYTVAHSRQRPSCFGKKTPD